MINIRKTKHICPKNTSYLLQGPCDQLAHIDLAIFSPPTGLHFIRNFPYAIGIAQQQSHHRIRRCIKLAHSLTWRKRHVNIPLRPNSIPKGLTTSFAPYFSISTRWASSTKNSSAPPLRTKSISVTFSFSVRFFCSSFDSGQNMISTSVFIRS